MVKAATNLYQKRQSSKCWWNSYERNNWVFESSKTTIDEVRQKNDIEFGVLIEEYSTKNLETEEFIPSKNGGSFAFR